MRVLFFEPEYTGHHFAFLGRMLPGFIDLPVEIVLATTPAALQSKEFAKSLAAFGDRLELVPCCTRVPRKAIPNARHRLRELSAAIQTIQPDHVAVCYVDGIWDAASLSTLMGRRPWPRELAVEGWLYRGRFGDPRDRRLKSIARRRLFRTMLRQGLFRRLAIDHEILFDFAEPLARDTPTEVVLTPNPIVLFPMLTQTVARERLGLPVDGDRLVTLNGVIGRFKGAQVLLEAYRWNREQATRVPMRLFLAGPHEGQIKSMLAEEPFRTWMAEGGIISLDQFLSEEQMFASAAASDLVVAPYYHEGRSSVILWSAAAGRPCLGTELGCPGRVICQHGLGGTCDVANPVALAESIATMLQSPWTADDAERVRGYAEFHRVENYQRIASDLVRRRLSQSKLNY